jgi:hypothetical protein
LREDNIARKLEKNKKKISTPPVEFACEHPPLA